MIANGRMGRANRESRHVTGQQLSFTSDQLLHGFAVLRMCLILADSGMFQQ